MIEPAGYNGWFSACDSMNLNHKTYGHFRAYSRSSHRSDLGAQHRPSRYCVSGTLDLLRERAGLPTGVHRVPSLVSDNSPLGNLDTSWQPNLGKPIRMRRNYGHIAWFGIGVVQWDILLNSEMQRFFLRRRRCSGVLSDILSRNYMLHDAEWRRHFTVWTAA